MPERVLPVGLVVTLPPASHTHVQDMPSSVWFIAHPLNYDPAGVLVTDDQGHQHFPIVTYPHPDQTVQLTFTRDVRGTARLS